MNKSSSRSVCQEDRYGRILCNMKRPVDPFSQFLKLARRSIQIWHQSRAEQAGAAISFFALFAFTPICFLAFSTAGFVLQKQQLEPFLLNGVLTLFGPLAEKVVQAALEPAFLQTPNILYIVSGSVLVVAGASGGVIEIQRALQLMIEGAVPEPSRTWRHMLLQRAASVVLVFGTGLLLAASFVVSVALDVLHRHFEQFGSDSVFFFYFLYGGIICVILMFFFTLLYRFLPSKKLAWPHLFRGASMAALLFLLGRYVVRLYVTHTSLSSIYGAASAFMIMMIWVYYMSQIFLFGAAWVRASSEIFSEPSASSKKKLS